MPKKIAALLMFLSALCVSAQGGRQNPQLGDKGSFTLSERSQLVTEAVTVRDKAGNPVTGLTTNDFSLTEDGVTQKIRYFEYQTLPLPSSPLPAANEKNVLLYKNLGRAKITIEDTSGKRYKDKRLMALYFDMSSMGQADRHRAIDAAEKFLRTQMTDVDLVSILRFDHGSVDVLADFTADRGHLLSILKTLAVGENSRWATAASDASAPNTGAAFGQDDSEFNIFNTDRQLAALQTAANMLGHLKEKKVLVYFASGLRLSGIDNQAQLHATIDSAIRAGVSLWPIDARGLVAEAPLGDATVGSPGGVAMYSGTAEQAVQSGFAQSQDTLYALAADTGGKALLDNNSLVSGIAAAQRSVSDYYILSYYTTNAAMDGRFRHIKITVNNSTATKIDYRQGYFAEKAFSKFTVADKERQLEDALMLDDPITELSIAMELNYFQINRAEYFVPLLVKIPGQELALARHGGADHTLLDFIGEIKDVYGNITVTNLRDHMDIKLTEQTEAELARVPVEYNAGFTLLPGVYTFKFLARDDETGRIGTYETTFTIPNLNRENQRVPISSVVLTSQKVPLESAVFNAMKSKRQAKEDARNPLISEGERLIPSVAHVFQHSRNLYVYLQGYEQAANAVRPLAAYVGFYRDRALQLETPVVSVAPAASTGLKVAPLNFSISLNDLQPGDYDCQVTVLDPATGKSTFWRAPIKILP